MRTIRDEVLNLKIPVVEFTSAVELLKDEKGQTAGAVLLNMETGDYSVARAKTVVIATGGAGSKPYQGFTTSTTEQLLTDSYLDTEQALPFFTRILSSIIQQVRSIRHRSLVPW